MKTNVLFFIFLILIVNIFSNAHASTIDSIEKRIKILEQKILIDEEDDDEMIFNANPVCAEKKIKIFKHGSCCPKPVVKTLPLSNKLLVLSPLFTVGLFFLITILFLKRRGYSLTQALSSKRMNEQGQTEYLPSSSKLLAFLSILFGLIFISFFFTFYFFMAFKHLPLPNFIGLWPVVFIIGLGILPYIIQTIFKK